MQQWHLTVFDCAGARVPNTSAAAGIRPSHPVLIPGLFSLAAAEGKPHTFYTSAVQWHAFITPLYCCTHTAGTWELLITGLKPVLPAVLLDICVKKRLLARHFIKRMKWMLNGIGGENSRQEARRFHGKLKVTAEMHRTDTETITLSVTDLLLQPSSPLFFNINTQATPVM